jgi:integrase
MQTETERRKIQYWEELSKVALMLALNCSKLVKHNGRVYGNIIDGGELWYNEFGEFFETKDEMKLESVDAYLAKNLLVNLSAEFPEFRQIKAWQEITKNDITPEMIRILNLVAHRRTFSENCEVSRAWGSGPVENDAAEALKAFLLLYTPGSTHDFYECYLTKSLPPLKLTSSTSQIQTFIDRGCGKKTITPGGRKAYFRAIRCFFNWAYSPASKLGFNPSDNPVTWVKPPKVIGKIMPAQDLKSLAALISRAPTKRDRAIISTLSDSSGRLTEVSRICENDILWDKCAIKVLAKGGREVLMPFSKTTEIFLKDWLAEYHPNGGPIWGIDKSGIVSMLRRLEKETGIKCNAHTFRRGFASILRRNCVDTLDIMKLGHWKSIQMVQKYTESVDFEDSQKRYKAPMGQLTNSTDRLSKKTNGLTKKGMVPKARIELATRGFSVRCSTI